jgi:DUF2889 family protein
LQRLIGERVGPGWRETVRRKIGRLETCTHLVELLGPAVTTLYQTMSYGRNPDGRDTLENRQNSGERPFFIGGCHSWRTDGPVVAAMFPQFATRGTKERLGAISYRACSPSRPPLADRRSAECRGSRLFHSGGGDVPCPSRGT